jgi:TfoX/Sxy family transcriptional regulator of competence genes
MEKGAWTKSPAELVELFEAVFPGPPAISRPMFGYPAGFVNGNMFMSLFQNAMVLRLAPEPRQQLLAMEGASVFEPMAGRPMSEYVVVPPAVLADTEALEGWVASALDFGISLPAKQPKAKKPKSR